MTDSVISRMEDVLANASELFAPFASKAVLEAEEAVQEVIQVYAPQPSRTRARTFNTYVRGQGNYPRSFFTADASEPGGFKVKRAKRGQIKLTSQQLDKRWTKNVKASGGTVEGNLHNSASYSGYVNGWEGTDPKQVSFHAASGWVSADAALAKAGPDIDSIVDAAVQSFLDKLAE
jgi:hypothetical protein